MNTRHIIKAVIVSAVLANIPIYLFVGYELYRSYL